MKHLSSMRETFPHFLDRNAIMGVAEKKPRKTPATLAEEEAEVKLKSSQFVTVKVFYTVRPYLPPCHCAVLSLPLKARSAELLDMAWDQFSQYREKMGPLLGPLPSENKDDFMLCFLQRGPPVSRAEFENVTQALSSIGAPHVDSPPPALALTPAPHSLPSSIEPQPLALDALMGTASGEGHNEDPFLSPTGDLAPPHTGRSRSNSAISSATVVTQQSIEEDEEEEDGLLEDRPQSAVEGVLATLRAQKQWANAAVSIIPGYDMQGAVEYCQPTAIVSRVATSRLALQKSAASGQHVDLHPTDAATKAATDAKRPPMDTAEDGDDGMVAFHLMLRPEVVLRERVVLEEEKTRLAAMEVFHQSWTSLLRFEMYCAEQTKFYQVRRLEEKNQIRAFEERELSLRHKLAAAEDHVWHDALGKFRRRYSELEVGMIAQYRQMRDIRKRHIEAMQKHGLSVTQE